MPKVSTELVSTSILPGLYCKHYFVVRLMQWSFNNVFRTYIFFVVLTSGGAEGYSCLHYCVDMHASAALDFLEALPGIDLKVTDEIGRTYRDLAVELGHTSMLKIAGK